MKKQYVDFEYEIEKFTLVSIETAVLSFAGGLNDNSDDYATDDFDF